MGVSSSPKAIHIKGSRPWPVTFRSIRLFQDRAGCSAFRFGCAWLLGRCVNPSAGNAIAGPWDSTSRRRARKGTSVSKDAVAGRRNGVGRRADVRLSARSPRTLGGLEACMAGLRGGYQLSEVQ